MFIVDDRSTTECIGTISSGLGVHVWGDESVGTIWIATRTDNHQWGAERFVCVGVAREPLSPAAQPVSGSEPMSFPACAHLSLNISARLLEQMGMSGHTHVPSRRVITDPVAFELALALVEAASLPYMNEYTRDCMVNMLCAQISEAALDASTPARRRTLGFEHWQRQKLEVALSELGKREISLELFANRCGLSVCHFARLFKMTYGMPFHQYIVQRQICRACALLSETQDAISHIALECGFSDQSSFTRRFSAETGMPPAAWRKALPVEKRLPNHGRN